MFEFLSLSVALTALTEEHCQEYASQTSQRPSFIYTVGDNVVYVRRKTRQTKGFSCAHFDALVLLISSPLRLYERSPKTEGKKNDEDMPGPTDRWKGKRCVSRAGRMTRR